MSKHRWDFVQAKDSSSIRPQREEVDGVLAERTTTSSAGTPRSGRPGGAGAKANGCGQTLDYVEAMRVRPSKQTKVE
jgi:hypothetical protein